MNNPKPSASNKGLDGGSYSDSATNSVLSQLKSGLAAGATIGDLMEDLDVWDEDGTARLRNYDSEFLRNWLRSQAPSISDLRRSQGGGI